MYQIILLSGNSEKNNYASQITQWIPNSVYLNINHLYTTFGKTPPSKLTEPYTYEQRIINPSHEVILGFAESNMKLNKVAIIDGDYQADLLNQYLPKIFAGDSKPNIRTIHFDTLTSINLDKKLDNTLVINTNDEQEKNNKEIHHFLSDVCSEENQEKNGYLLISTGLGGSGKTTLSENLVKQMSNMCYFDSDMPTFPYLLDNEFPSDFYGQYIKDQRYLYTVVAAHENITLHKKNAIIDGYFGDKFASPILSLAYTPGVIPIATYCHCTGPSLDKRIIERAAPRDKFKLDKLKLDREINIKKHLVHFAQVEDTESIVFINTEDKSSLAKNTQYLLSKLQSSNIKPLSIKSRTTKFDETLCNITSDEAQAGLDQFKNKLNDIRQKDTVSSEHKGNNSNLVNLNLFKKNTLKPLPLVTPTPGLVANKPGQ